ncbi:quinolinate chloroplastic [Chlorella sorokiniana]|uniref:quinolinate synthase n=1 Tax=Chlorella sorokiniana TaxID=3076 RepID=A0A2P6TPP4_CHLSO|nr:quinolinate chloroplastic [Chlorella sorokiniana]|eukprot:PRW56007.1 quinolinate chloroplastic [Chlorella sorokiniana]
MAAVAVTAAALAPAVAGGAHKGAATLRRWSAATARPAGRRAAIVCQQQPERRGSTLAARAAAAEVVAAVPFPTPALEPFAAELQAAGGQQERSRLLLGYARRLPAYPEAARTDAHRVMGCTAQVWVSAELDAAGKVRFAADSDSELTRGLAALLVEGLSGLTPDEVLQVDPACLGQLGLGPAVLTRSRANGFLNMLESMKKRARMLAGDLPRFPSLLITAEGTAAQGAFAEAQNKFLRPDPAVVDALVAQLQAKQIGVVAHFYMDPEVQGVLSSAAERWPHINISDSLVMADGAVKMAEAGCKAIAVLGVDFMSENVRAILDEAGYKDVAVYRMAAESIGCSLAEAAESPAYESYLAEAGATPTSLHVVYINTSLKTKALAHQQVPTITCTSSNVVQTVLTAFAEVPDVHVWYGPDTYMGRNLAQLFQSLAQLSDEEVRELHPAHTQASIRSLLPRLRYFDQGTCIVHHLFGGEVCELVKEGYRDAYLTAHFEVPGEMFSLAMEAKRQRGMGVVGSTQNILDFIAANFFMTQNILDFIAAKLTAALEAPYPDRLQFVLGTESGMITSIVRKVQGMLHAAGRSDVSVEIVFPVSPEAITTDKQAGAAQTELPSGLSVVPGPAGGEGCSLEGGCASCPYMKMNSLAALTTVCERVGTPGEALLEAFKPRPYTELVGGKTMAQAGCVPILHMRGFQKGGQLPADLVAVYERRSLDAMLGGPSGLGLANNAMKALCLLSGAGEGACLAEEVAAAGVEDRYFKMTTQAGKLVQAFPMRNGARPTSDGSIGSYSLTRPNLQRTLYAALPPGTVTCDASFRSCALREDGRVEVTLALSDGTGSRAGGTGAAAGAVDGAAAEGAGTAEERVEICDLLVGADGIRSRVRTCLEERHGIEARHPQYSGYAYIRGLVDLSLWPGGVAGWQKQWAGTHLVYGTCGAGIVTPDTLCFGRYVPAPQGTFSPGLMPPAKAKDALEDLCHDYGPMRELSLMTEAPRVACGELWQLPSPKEVWGAGCVTLVGDAAHAMLPALGQGACQAIEDAVELAVTLHQAASAKAAAPTNGAASAQLSASELETALRRYEAVRGPHTAGVRNMAEATFKHAAGETWWARVKRECWFW